MKKIKNLHLNLGGAKSLNRQQLKEISGGVGEALKYCLASNGKEGCWFLCRSCAEFIPEPGVTCFLLNNQPANTPECLNSPPA